jgi:formylglycine-generating enzyme required for sulfatase activity
MPIGRRFLLAVAFAAALGTAAAPASQYGLLACAEPPLAIDDVVYMLQNDVPAARIRQRVESCGVTFIPGAAEIKRLRSAGASADLIALLAPPSSPAPGQSWTAPSDGRPMVWIPPGSLQMGTPDSESVRDADETVNTVSISGFWMDDAEVTNAAFRRFVIENSRWQKDRIDRSLHDGNYLRDWTGNDFPSGEGDRPVVYVSWHAARAYAAWVGKRLPTEAEWEYAARAGTSGPYWWPGAFDAARANNGPARLSTRTPSTRNPWGLHDMLGNVAEWVSSAYRPYPYRADDGREAASGADPRSHRGGAWNQRDVFLRAANRNSAAPTITTDQLGFRCAR